MTLLGTGSILTAFFAGMVALFAPCCIVFLAPSYLAAAARNRRWRLLPLTFVFAAGLALIMVPITTGMSLVAGTIAKYHAPLYYVGGVLMLLLAACSLSGYMWSMPSFLRAPDATRGDSASFFALGVFSGIASSCCAPVLAGVMTLSALSGSPVGGTLLGLSFVLGMTFPLFILALTWDRLRLRDKTWLKARAISFRLGARRITTNSVNIAVAAAFAIMGGFVIYLAGSRTMTTGPGIQVAIGRWLSRVFTHVQQWLAPVPEPVLGLLVAGIAAARHTPFLIDTNGTVAAEYGTLGKGMHAGLPGHSFVLIDTNGVQRWYGEYPSMYLPSAQLLNQIREHLPA